MDMKRDYYEDIRLFESKVVLFWTIAFLSFLFSLPLYTSSYYLFLFNIIMVHVIMAVGLNILMGYTGQISLGHAGFFAIGAYGTALLMTKLHLPFLLALPLAGFIAAFFGFILGLPALRLEGPYLAIASMGFGLTIMHVIGRWEIFGGRMGIQAPDLDLGFPQLGLTWVVKSDLGKYYLILIITILLVVAARNIMKTRVGRSFVAIRDSDIAAEVIGINLTKYKTLSFMVRAFYTGVAGGLFIIFLVMVVVGGLGSIMGSIAGAALITYLQYSLLKNVGEKPIIGDLLVAISKKWFTVNGLENFNSIILGLIMLAIIIFEPLGIFGIWIRLKKYWKTWPF
jgi:branched-chain amino acid transport system permease protein